jgi:hypothetical protein
MADFGFPVYENDFQYQQTSLTINILPKATNINSLSIKVLLIFFFSESIIINLLWIYK